MPLPAGVASPHRGLWLAVGERVPVARERPPPSAVGRGAGWGVFRLNVTSSLQPAPNRPVLRLKPSLQKQSQDSPRLGAQERLGESPPGPPQEPLPSSRARDSWLESLSGGRNHQGACPTSTQTHGSILSLPTNIRDKSLTLYNHIHDSPICARYLYGP